MSRAVRSTLLLVVALAAAAGLLWDAVTPLPADGVASGTVTPDISPVAESAPDSGAWYCPAVAVDDDTTVLTIVPTAGLPAGADDEASPGPATEGAEDSEAADAAEVAEPDEPDEPDAPARSEVVIRAGGEPVERVTVDDAPVTVTLDGDRATLPVAVRWSGQQVLVTSHTTGEDPVAQRCQAQVTGTWYVPGFTTTLGNAADLHVYNPFSVDAVIQVRFATPDGPVELVSTQDLAVPAGEQLTVDLDEVQPEVSDLGVIVDVLGGRVVTTGEMRFGPADDEDDAVSGRTLLPATGDPATRHLLPYGAIAPGDAYTWVQVMNPSEDEALVLASVSAPDPSAETAEEIAVPPGSTVRLDLSGRSERRTFATDVTVVNDVDALVTRVATRTAGDDTAVDAAASVPSSTAWVLAGLPDDSAGRVDVYNPGPGTATVTLAPVGGAPPDAWREVALEPNEQRGFVLDELAEPAAALRLTADEPVAAALRSATAPSGPAGFLTVAGFPAESWQRTVRRPGVDFDDRLDTLALPEPSASTPAPAEPTATPGADPAPAVTSDPTVVPEATVAPTAAPGASSAVPG